MVPVERVVAAAAVAGSAGAGAVLLPWKPRRIVGRRRPGDVISHSKQGRGQLGLFSRTPSSPSYPSSSSSSLPSSSPPAFPFSPPTSSYPTFPITSLPFLPALRLGSTGISRTGGSSITGSSGNSGSSSRSSSDFVFDKGWQASVDSGKHPGDIVATIVGGVAVIRGGGGREVDREWGGGGVEAYSETWNGVAAGSGEDLETWDDRAADVGGGAKDSELWFDVAGEGEEGEVGRMGPQGVYGGRSLAIAEAPRTFPGGLELSCILVMPQGVSFGAPAIASPSEVNVAFYSFFFYIGRVCLRLWFSVLVFSFIVGRGL